MRTSPVQQYLQASALDGLHFYHIYSYYRYMEEHGLILVRNEMMKWYVHLYYTNELDRPFDIWESENWSSISSLLEQTLKSDSRPIEARIFYR